MEILWGQCPIEVNPYLRLSKDCGFVRDVERWMSGLNDFKRDWIYLQDEAWEGVMRALSDLAETDAGGLCLKLVMESPGVLINAVLSRVAECMEAGRDWEAQPPLSPGDLNPAKKHPNQAPAAPDPASWPLEWMAFAVCNHQSRHLLVDGFKRPASLSRCRQMLTKAGVSLDLLDRVCRFVWPCDMEPQDLLELCAS